MTLKYNENTFLLMLVLKFSKVQLHLYIVSKYNLLKTVHDMSVKSLSNVSTCQEFPPKMFISIYITRDSSSSSSS